jgi:N-acetylglucosaminyl-diphospho-decaprenol L-rhamnosyltransferase
LSVCVIVVSYRTGPALGRCLDALAAVRGVDEIVLVDNGNAVAEEAVLSAFPASDSRAQLLRGHGNVGFAAACNLAARVAQAQTLLFLNPDAVLEADAVESLSSALAAAPSPAIIGGDLRDADGRPERGARRDHVTLWRAFVAFSGLSRLERLSPAFRDFNRHTDPMPSHPIAVQAISGALLMVRRADFEALGGFDEGYFVHVEDLDICRRAEQRGWPVVFAPGPHGRHERSTSAVESGFIAKHKARGMARYLSKFARGPLERAIAWLAGRFIMLVSR